MRRLLYLIPFALAVVSGYHLLPAQSGGAPKPLKALLIAGGCCHDYAKQQEILSKGIQARANVQVDVIWTDDKSTTPPLPLYDNADWAKGYDIIIHDECAAGTKDPAVLQRVLDAHKTIPAIHLHCAMHSFRTGSDAWFKHLGLQSTGHGPQEPVAIRYVDSSHPITKPLQDWTTIKEELYNNVNIFDAHPLAMGKQSIKQKDGTTKDVEYIVAWTNEKSGAKSFSTTIGHNNDTVADARYLDLLTRGVLWACDKLEPAYQVPFTGQNKVTFVKANAPAAKPQASAAAEAPLAAAKDATLVKATASSEEEGKANFAWKAVDGSKDSRWCANGGDRPQWLQLEFDKPRSLTGAKIVWESQGNLYPHKLETSTDGKAWTVVADTTQNAKGGDSDHAFTAKDVRFLKLTVVGTPQQAWVSVREFTVAGEGIKTIAAKVNAKEKAASKKDDAKNSGEFAKEGNITPTIVKLTAEQEAEILKDVKVPDGFEATVFASPPAVNYPVYVAAAPDGTLYVSSDGNGSLGRNPKRGRIIRLKDLDGDGRADEVKEFVKDVDSPRGLVWDHDRLYLVHPPHLSVFIDKNGDGVSDEQKVLVKDLAFGFKDRPADHTTNGLSLGVDGWLYIAGGDFGFMQAEGTDGRKVQHRGGGVIRVRPDGTGLEIYATGTRNILEVAVSPTMDIFARDNTNDGGGWNVRFHHFTGLEDHGYPRLYKNFADEAITPLADYGGGSGCGAVYIDEPGLGKWNNAPFTADWGTGALWHHTVKPKGATYEETTAPQPFIKMTRPTDADVDASSNVYCASWKGATFNWEGPNVGYVVRVKPKGFKAAPLPDYAKATNPDLVKELSSPSYRRRVEAVRELMRRKVSKEVAVDLASTFRNKDLSPEARIAAIYAMRLTAKEPSEFVVSLASPSTEGDWQVVANAYRAELHEGGMPFGSVNISASKDTSIYSDPRLSVQMARTLVTLSDKAPRGPLNVARFLNAKQDEAARHVAIRALGMSGASKDLFGIIDANPTDSAVEKVIDDTARKSALRALAMIHKPEVVDGLITRVDKANDPALRKGILSALARLHFTEGEWKGDSWGTRPDTRGPYYQPEAWGESPKIATTLKGILAKASSEDAAYLVGELNRNRIQFNEALDRILALAANDSKLLPDAVGQLANAETIPAAGIPLLINAASSNPPISATVLSQAIVALTKTDSADGVRASLNGLVSLTNMKDAGKELETARTAFLSSAKLENHHQLLEVEAEKIGTPTALWADAALLNLSSRKTGSPESRELSGKALDHGWENTQRRVQILKAVAQLKHNPYADKVLAAVNDPDKAVAAAATNAAKAMKLEKKTKDTGPLISTLQPADVLAQILKTKGDPELGEQLFTRQTCVACHTTREDEAQKGPYLGNIAQTYKREELATAILDPNKTIAQGFATELFALKDGTQQLGFVTLESADQVKIRTITAQEFSYKVADIAKREKLPMSMMPPGLVMNLTVKEFASLLDYLQALSKK